MRETPSLRTPIKNVTGLGSARHGTAHWRGQRLTAIALAVLSLYVVTTFFTHVVFGDYASAAMWLKSPYAATGMILFLLAGCHHAAAGVQVVIEDYVHCEGMKAAGIIIVKFVAAALALLGTLAVLKILLGV